MKITFKKQHDMEYEFRISRIAEGNFKNLWRLEAKTPQDVEFAEICDADSLSTVISKVGYIFEQDGL